RPEGCDLEHSDCLTTPVRIPKSKQRLKGEIEPAFRQLPRQAHFVFAYVTSEGYGSGTNQKWVRTPLRCRGSRHRRRGFVFGRRVRRAVAKPASAPRELSQRLCASFRPSSDLQGTRHTQCPNTRLATSARCSRRRRPMPCPPCRPPSSPTSARARSTTTS